MGRRYRAGLTVARGQFYRRRDAEHAAEFGAELAGVEPAVDALDHPRVRVPEQHGDAIVGMPWRRHQVPNVRRSSLGVGGEALATLDDSTLVGHQGSDLLARGRSSSASPVKCTCCTAPPWLCAASFASFSRPRALSSTLIGTVRSTGGRDRVSCRRVSATRARILPCLPPDIIQLIVTDGFFLVSEGNRSPVSRPG